MSEEVAADREPARELTMSIDEVGKASQSYLLAVTMATVFFYVIVNGLSTPESLPVFLVRLFYLILAYLLGIVLHEGAHVLGMLIFGRVSGRSIRVGHRIREGVIYVHTAQPMTASAYRKVLLLPAFAVGLLPTILGITWGDGWLTAFGWLMTISAAGDVAVWRLIRPLDAGQMVQDHPSEVGVIVA